ncbi:MAG: 1-phosphofructokinase family hexose kinase [Ferruginibacter sp.]|nr:1-phosphofructokinase family hexose kinase [Cytophagales bacterium]
MKAIVTLTMNPTIDKNTKVEQLIPEQKLRCDKPAIEPGGGGINVSRVIHRLGGDSLAVFTAGANTGKTLREMLSQEGVPQLAIPIAHRTRENFIVLETLTNQQYRFSLGGPTLSEKEWQACLTTLAGLDPRPDYLVASGSLPPGVPSDFYARVARLAREMGSRFILDTSGEALQLAANEGVYLLKPNLLELTKLVGSETVLMGGLEGAARQVIARGHCEVVVISMGPEGALLVSDDVVARVHVPPAPKRSTVGAGDSMVAGMVLGLSRGWSLSEMVRYGVACGTAATMNSGTELCHPEDVAQLLSQMG